MIGARLSRIDPTRPAGATPRRRTGTHCYPRHCGAIDCPDISRPVPHRYCPALACRGRPVGAPGDDPLGKARPHQPAAAERVLGRWAAAPLPDGHLGLPRHLQRHARQPAGSDRAAVLSAARLAARDAAPARPRPDDGRRRRLHPRPLLRRRDLGLGHRADVDVDLGRRQPPDAAEAHRRALLPGHSTRPRRARRLRALVSAGGPAGLGLAGASRDQPVAGRAPADLADRPSGLGRAPAASSATRRSGWRSPRRSACSRIT